MKVTVPIILTLIMISIGQAAFAQAPKDVNVVNNPTVTVGNLPDVNVINDATSPIPVTIQNGGQTTVEWRYVGLTTHEDDGLWEYGGLLGIPAMNKACANDYGSSARSATIPEAYFRDDTDPRGGWLAPGGPMLVLSGGGTQELLTTFDSATGIQVGQPEQFHDIAMNHAYCVQYTSSISTLGAPRVTSAGIVSRSGCGPTRPAACAAPVAITVVP